MTFRNNYLQDPHLFTARLLVMFGSALLFLCALLFFSAYQARRLIQGPVIFLHTPTVITTDSPVVTISGSVANVSFLWLDGKEILTNGSGYFEQTLLVHAGSSILEIEAKDKSERKTIRRIQIFHEAPPADQST